MLLKIYKKIKENLNRQLYNIVVYFQTYRAETWTMTKKEEDKALFIFESKVFRRMYDPKYEDGE
jgi:hypothetical protein